MRSALCWLPVIMFLCTAIGFSISYVLAVTRNDVYAWWPYISDTGTHIPESCIFGQLLNFTAFLAFATMYVRYKLVQAFNNHDRKLRRLNKVSLFFGGLSALGVSLVANFQESSVIQVHIVGAGMAFGLGVVYCFLQSDVTRLMYPMYNSRFIWVIRLMISLISLVSFVTTITFAGIATNKAGDFRNSSSYPLHWNSTDPGFDEHVVSTVSEWMIGITFLSFFLSYTRDFQKISIRIIPELLVSHLDETPIIFSNTERSPTERTGLLA